MGAQHAVRQGLAVTYKWIKEQYLKRKQGQRVVVE